MFSADCKYTRAALDQHPHERHSDSLTLHRYSNVLLTALNARQDVARYGPSHTDMVADLDRLSRFQAAGASDSLSAADEQGEFITRSESNASSRSKATWEVRV
jgi:hypothetical protein